MECPTDDTIQCGDTEHEQENARDLDDVVVELPNICPPCSADVAITHNAAPTACWELPQNEAYIHVSSIGDDILN